MLALGQMQYNREKARVGHMDNTWIIRLSIVSFKAIFDQPVLLTHAFRLIPSMSAGAVEQPDMDAAMYPFWFIQEALTPTDRKALTSKSRFSERGNQSLYLI